MLKLTPHQRLLLAVEPADFRRGVEGLAAICKQKLEIDPFSGAVFAFANRKKTAVKLLIYDSNGFWLCMKRFSQGKLAWWPTEARKAMEIQAEALSVLLSQGDPRFMFSPLPWRKITENPLVLKQPWQGWVLDPTMRPHNSRATSFVGLEKPLLCALAMPSSIRWGSPLRAPQSP